MGEQRICVVEYRRRGQTTQWDAVSPGRWVRCNPEDRWADGEVRVEQQGNQIVISAFSEEAIQENDATPAEELANEELQRRFPGHTIVYPPEENTP